ncbi:hypothetical protein M514_05950 [Trichuris suis]|uniref:Uncharacterized protein n=1 Tax=Trichuris suis TaxID=68888 RepID=A0A085N7V1_9BILA|nr:hypothetical protein M513_05950 [Trichuris suis]KFD65547.1 hypothetical protein M514_05950 [Trichuris suis]
MSIIFFRCEDGLGGGTSASNHCDVGEKWVLIISKEQRSADCEAVGHLHVTHFLRDPIVQLPDFPSLPQMPGYRLLRHPRVECHLLFGLTSV